MKKKLKTMQQRIVSAVKRNGNKVVIKFFKQRSIVMRKVRITLMIVVLTIGMFGLSGCETSSAQRIATLQTVITQAQQLSASYDVQVGTITASIPGLEQAMSDGNLPPAMRQKAIDTLNLLKGKLATIQNEKVKVDNAIANYQKAILTIDTNAPNLATELQVYGTGMQQIAPVAGPYAGWVYLVGLGLTTIGGIGAAAKKAADEKKAKASLDQVVTGNQIYMDANPTAAPVLKAAQSQVQTQDTVNAVAAIKLS